MSLLQAEATTVETNGHTPKISFEEWLQLPEDLLSEWVDGEVQHRMPPIPDHQILSSWLDSLLSHWVEEHDAGIIIPSPVAMRLPNRPSGREPDILFLARESVGRLQRTHIDGPADLVIEIISPESRARDRREKLLEYEAAGIPEYWIIDPERQRVEWHQRGEDGLYELSSPDAEGVYRSRVLPGLWMREAWLWQRPLPIRMDVLREWKLI